MYLHMVLRELHIIFVYTIPNYRVAMHELCYNFKELFVQERGKVSKAIGFTKLLIKVRRYTV